MIKKIISGVVLYALFSLPLVASEDRALFWRVDSAESTVYLLGSIHFADDSFYPLRKEIEQAFELSETLVVEVDINAPESMASFQRLMQEEGVYGGDETLRDHLSRKTYEDLQGYLKELDVPLYLVEKQKPGIVVLTLAAIEAQRVGLNPEQGIDSYFLSRIKNNKKIVALETIDEQLRIFLDIEDADALLQDSLHSLEELEEEMEILINAWKQGDEKAIYQLLFKDVVDGNAAIIDLYERLYFQRNIKMTGSIKNYLKQKGQYFVVVGGGHLVGDKGIVHLLKNAGYRINRL
ncbi:MAG: TraB/GumN family protein [Gammaproteobacteria bacterium]|nr:TraB/GumN family protein [Gammaproteobacteria bacterium]MCW8923104.1 TraB/GumN family protein [Gammaproteobacteria bacterium]